MKLQFCLFLVLLPLFSKCDLLTAEVFREGVTPYCNEECPAGYDYIPELGHCYRLLLDLGPTSQDRAVDACGSALGYLPIFDNHHDEDIIRSFYWGKYKNQMKAHKSWLKNSGFWTAYMRMSKDGHTDEELPHMFKNMYTGDPMPMEYWRPGGNPRNERYDQCCVARKWFNAEYIPLDDVKSPDLNGLDDYVCGYPHWVVCQVRKEYALNKRAYNVALMDAVKKGEVTPENTECSEPWDEQIAKQFDILIESATLNGNQKALNAYEVAKDNIIEPIREVNVIN